MWFLSRNLYVVSLRALPRHPPPTHPNVPDNLLLCVSYVKGKVHKMSGPNFTDIFTDFLYENGLTAPSSAGREAFTSTGEVKAQRESCQSNQTCNKHLIHFSSSTGIIWLWLVNIFYMIWFVKCWKQPVDFGLDPLFPRMLCVRRDLRLLFSITESWRDLNQNYNQPQLTDTDELIQDQSLTGRKTPHHTWEGFSSSSSLMTQISNLYQPVN